MDALVTADERAHGIRWSWNVWPGTRTNAVQCVVPISCLYTPFIESDSIKNAYYEPVTCENPHCNAVLNTYCKINLRTKSWSCVICQKESSLPALYAQHMSEQNMPLEMLPDSITTEYIMPPRNKEVSGPIYLFVLDTLQEDVELEAVKDSLRQALNVMPENAIIGLITFGRYCQIHDLSNAELPRMYCFRGNQEITAPLVASTLGFGARNDPRGVHSSPAVRRFLAPAGQADFVFNTILDDIEPCSWPPHNPKERRQCCTSTAISLAVNLLACAGVGEAARIIMLCASACTIGPGAVLPLSTTMHMRSHDDMRRGEPNTKLVEPARTFYQHIARTAGSNRHTIDIFMGGLEQIGLYEMRSLADRTGGVMLLSETFSSHVFKDTFKQLFHCDSDNPIHAYSVSVEVLCSPDHQLRGILGPCTSIEKESPSVGDDTIGEGGTCQWSMGTLHRDTTLAVLFNLASANKLGSLPRKASTQFHCYYSLPDGRKVLRVTTMQHRYAENVPHEMTSWFDQYAAAIIMGRIAIWQKDRDYENDAVNFLDRMLIRLCSTFATYTVDEVSSFTLPNQFSVYPQIMYYMRRCNMLRDFNCCPDETAVSRYQFLRQNCSNAMIIIRPLLWQYTMRRPQATSVLLDSTCVRHDVVLVLDEYIRIVVWRGERVQAWIDANYHTDPKYAALAEMLTEAETDAKEILASRFPTPYFVSTTEGTSQARFVVARVNPRDTHKESTTGATQILTEEEVLGSDADAGLNQIQGTVAPELLEAQNQLKLLKTGTTICGVVCKDCIVIGADTRATAGPIVATKNCFKVHKLHDNIYACGAGTAADLDHQCKQMNVNLELHESISGFKPRCIHVVRKFSRLLHKHQGHLGCALVLGGVDCTGPHLYDIHPHGSYNEHRFVAQGSGSLAALSVLEYGYDDNLDMESCVNLVADAVEAGITNDLYSGDNVDICIIRSTGIEVTRQYRKIGNRLEKSCKKSFAEGCTISRFKKVLSQLQVPKATEEAQV